MDVNEARLDVRPHDCTSDVLVHQVFAPVDDVADLWHADTLVSTCRVKLTRYAYGRGNGWPPVNLGWWGVCACGIVWGPRKVVEDDEWRDQTARFVAGRAAAGKGGTDSA